MFMVCIFICIMCNGHNFNIKILKILFMMARLRVITGISPSGCVLLWGRYDIYNMQIVTHEWCRAFNQSTSANKLCERRNSVTYSVPVAMGEWLGNKYLVMWQPFWRIDVGSSISPKTFNFFLSREDIKTWTSLRSLGPTLSGYENAGHMYFK